MDSFIEFIVTIALVALFSMPSLLKKRTDKKAVPNAMPAEDFGADEVQEVMYDADMDETGGQPKQEKEYFTYERMPEVRIADSGATSTKGNHHAQVVEDKRNEHSLLDFSEEEILKGVIYSEILKKKF